MLAPISEAPPSEEPLLRLGLAQRARLPGVRGRAARTPRAWTPGYLRCGTLAVARDADEAEALERELALRQRLGLAASAGCARARRGGSSRRWRPALRLALDVPDDHAIDPRKLTAALAAALTRRRRRAADRRPRWPSVAVDRRPGRTACGWPTASDGRAPSRSWSPPACGRRSSPGIPEDARVPIRPVKGQILRLHDPAGPGLLHARRCGCSRRLRRPARRRSLRARRDDGGARLRHDRHRRRRVRAAARRDRAAARGHRAGDRRARRPGCGRARPTTRRRSGPGALDGPALGDRPLPPRRSCSRRSRRSSWPAALAGEALPELAAAFAPGRFAGVAVAA